MSRDMKKSGIEWIGEYPNYFENKKIKYLIEKRYGGCWGNDPIDGKNNLCIRIADFDFETQTIKSTASTMRNYSKTQLSNGLLKDGDIIIEKSGGGDKTPVGRSVLYSEKKFPHAMFANFCDAIRPNREVCNKYLAYCLKAFYQNYDMHLFFNQTTGLQNLNMGTYLNSKMPVPSYLEQIKIANFLDSKCSEIDSLTKDIEHQIEVLEEYKKSVITEAVTKGLNPDVPMKDSEIEWAEKIPEHWDTMPNKYLMRKIKKTCSHYDGQDIISLSMNGVVVRNFEAGGKMPATFDGYQFIKPGNLLMCLFDYDVTPRCIGLIKNAGLTSPAYSHFEMKDNNYAPYYYYYYLMIDNTKELLHLAKNLRHSFTEDELGRIKQVVPPENEQIEIAHYLDSKCSEIDSIIVDKKKQLDTLAEYKKSLIYEYVTGKKEVI